MSWWASTPVASLSQGDVIGKVPVAVVLHPLAPLAKRDLPGQRGAWVPLERWPHEGDAVDHLLGRGRVIPVLVMSESCQLDKKETIGRVLVAPLVAAANMREEDRRILWDQKRRSKLPLPDVPSLGSYYADFRLMTAVDVKFVDAANRIAQLSQEGVQRLQMQLLAFFTGLNTERLFKAAFDVDQETPPVEGETPVE